MPDILVVPVTAYPTVSRYTSMKKLAAPFEHLQVCPNDEHQIARGCLTISRILDQTPFENYVDHVHCRIVWEDRSQVVFRSIKPLSW